MADVNAILGAAGSGLSFLSNAFNSSQAFSRQKDLMRMQQKFAVENWNRENSYNTPKAQMERLRDAGLNPNLMYEGGAGSLQAGSIDAPSAPTAPMTAPVSNPVSDAVQAAQGMALAKKAGSEKIGQDIENEYDSKTLKDRIEYVGILNDWTKEDRARITNEISLMVGRANIMQSEAEKLKSEKKLTDLQVKNYQKEVDARVSEMKSSAEYKKALKDLTESQKKVIDDTMESVVALAGFQKDLVGQSLSLLKKYGDAQAIVGMLSQLVSSAMDILDSVTGTKKIGALVNAIKSK